MRALGVRKLEFARHWSVLGFFVPVLNVVRPYQVIAEVWRASDPSVLDPFEWKSVEAPQILALWWGTFVIAVTLEFAAFGFELTAGVPAFKSLVASSVAIVADLAAAVSASLGFFVVAPPDRHPDGEARAAAGRGRARVSHRFDTDTAVWPVGENRFETRIDPGWWVVAGPNGGYVAAILLRALALAQGDPARAPRSLTIHYTSPPQAGPAAIETRIERAGRSLTTVSGRLLQGGKLRALALGAFSTEREGPEFAEARMPEVLPPERCPAWEKRIEIHDRYELRWAIGAPPFSGGEHALAGGWIRFPEPRALDALADRGLRRCLSAGGLLALAGRHAHGRRADHRPHDPLPSPAAGAGARARRLVARRLPLARGARRLRRGRWRDLDPRRRADRAVAPARAAALIGACCRRSEDAFA